MLKKSRCECIGSFDIFPIFTLSKFIIMNKKLSFLLLLLISSTLVLSCAKKKAREQAEKDDAIIQKYISDNQLDATKTTTGLYVVIDTAGTGLQPTTTSTVKVAYKGYLTNGEVFDQSVDGITFGLTGVIRGWTEGIPYYKEGGSGKLLIPSALGYGDKPQGMIPANSVLIFDVRLLRVFN
jgi:FKBP-type peptidyl-prolyl cis-trans isomerase FkpA